MESDSGPFSLTISPVKLADIPDLQDIIAAGERVLSSTTSWKEGKTFHGNVNTYRSTLANGDSWHCRASQHTDVSFEIFWKCLGMNKAENEQQFIPDIQYVHVAPADQIQAANPKISGRNQNLVSTFYHFSIITSDRVFTVLQTTCLSEDSKGMRQGIVVSIPINLHGSASESLELDDDGKQRIRGRYVSVERLLEGSDGSVEWRMATSSTPDGLIPQFLVERSLPSSIAADVPHFLSWLKTKRVVL